MNAPELAVQDLSPLQHGSLRERLREETNAVHQSLHRNAGLHQLISSQNSINLYKNVLKVFYDFYSGVDDSFNFVAPPLRFAGEAKPMAWLAQDFSALAINVDAPVKPMQSTLADLLPKRIEIYLGYLYVKQGSTLGGQAISKHLKKSLNLVPGETQFFFHGFGECTGANWKEFLQFLERLEPELDGDLVVKAAQIYFQLLDAAFNQHFPLEGINGSK